MTGTESRNDLVYRILDRSCFFCLSGTDVRIHFEEKLRHCAIGAANPSVCSHEPSADKLLIRSVEDNALLAAQRFKDLDILHGHGRIFYTDHIGIFPHFPEK